MCSDRSTHWPIKKPVTESKYRSYQWRCCLCSPIGTGCQNARQQEGAVDGSALPGRWIPAEWDSEQRRTAQALHKDTIRKQKEVPTNDAWDKTQRSLYRERIHKKKWKASRQTRTTASSTELASCPGWEALCAAAFAAVSPTAALDEQRKTRTQKKNRSR